MFDIPWPEMKEKCEYWVQFNICDEFFSSKWYDKRYLSANDVFFVAFASVINIKVICPFNCPLRCVIIQ